MKYFNTTAYSLKWIAIVAMLIDHIAWAFVPSLSLTGQLMHIIGRITAPIMCYFVAEGFLYTHNLKKYITRLAIFAVISHFAFSFFENGTLVYMGTSVIYTLLLGLIALAIWKNENVMHGFKITLVVILCMLALFGDWIYISVLWVLFFGIYAGKRKQQFISFSIIGLNACLLPLLIQIAYAPEYWWRSLFQFGIYLAIPLLMTYNGSLGGGKNSKWLFYIFYPTHLFLLGILKFFIQ